MSIVSNHKEFAAILRNKKRVIVVRTNINEQPPKVGDVLNIENEDGTSQIKRTVSYIDATPGGVYLCSVQP